MDVGLAVGKREAQRVTVEIETVEREGRLADGTAFPYWTFGGKVPGPMLRVRVGDTIAIRLKNHAGSKATHSIDLHAVSGPGGGSDGMQVAPGEEQTFTFRALNPGLYLYHCATPPVPMHIASGMYGLILVEPEGGLSPVDREFYVVQGEVYAAGKRGTQGRVAMDYAALEHEHPTYVVFNGSFKALTDDLELRAQVGERIRIFFGNAGPQLVTSLHLIGEIFDVVHAQGAAEPSHNVQTTLVPSGGAAWLEFVADVPGRYLLVDHSLFRATDKGALAHLNVEGPPDPAIFDGGE